MTWRSEIPEGNESLKIKYEIVPYTRGRVLDIGAGPWRTYPHFTTVDNMSEWDWMPNWKPDFNSDVTKLPIFSSGSFDAVFSSHVLEHIQNAFDALKEWWRLIKKNGYLVLYLPHADLYPKKGEPGSNPNHVHEFLPKDIINLMKNITGWDLVISEVRSQDDEYSFLQVYKKTGDKQNQFSYSAKKPDKTAAIIRYGGLGDMIQLSPIMASLKDLGYHTTLWTTEHGAQVVRHDPNIDEIVLQDKNQVPNSELVNFWGCIEKRYDKFINLSESVEGSLLAMVGRAPFKWNKEARHRYMNINYDEMAHLIAGVPRKHPPKFYPTDDEIVSANRLREKIGGKLIMMALSGSSVHKVYPWMDQVIAHFMLASEVVKFVLVGAEIDQYLEAPWVNENRVILKSGKMSVRETMSLASKCDVVMGPETGILNSVSHEQVPKIVLLSHSTVENLTRDWVNTQSLFALLCPCYPCHKMIYGFDECTRAENTGVALCMERITPDLVIDAINKVI